jgi:hypothetical protein
VREGTCALQFGAPLQQKPEGVPDTDIWSPAWISHVTSRAARGAADFTDCADGRG